ncbi:MAG: hypothetical protein JSV49_10715 [Thermoplasmata archaeon]|nr:MAG: hypothetical protein JSV49_10715 [Thermoplasmata archaeon]
MNKKLLVIIIIFLVYTSCVFYLCNNYMQNNNYTINIHTNANKTNEPINEESMVTLYEIDISTNSSEFFDIIVPICINWDGTVSSLYNNLTVIGSNVSNFEIISTELKNTKYNIGLRLIGFGNVTLKAYNYNWLEDFDEKNQSSITLSLIDISTNPIIPEYENQGFPHWVYLNSSIDNGIYVRIKLYFHIIMKPHNYIHWEIIINGYINNGWQSVDSFDIHMHS